MGGFVCYGEIKNDFVMVKGFVFGIKKCIMIFCKFMFIYIFCKVFEKVEFKWIDIFFEFGYGVFQIFVEKKQYQGIFKKDLVVSL